MGDRSATKTAKKRASMVSGSDGVGPGLTMAIAGNRLSVLVKAASGGSERGMKIAQAESLARHRRQQKQGGVRHSVHLENICRSLATSNRNSATAAAAPSISASAIARRRRFQVWEEGPSPIDAAARPDRWHRGKAYRKCSIWRR